MKKWFKFEDCGDLQYAYGTQSEAAKYSSYLGSGKVAAVDDKDLIAFLESGSCDNHFLLCDAIENIEEGRNALREW